MRVLEYNGYSGAAVQTLGGWKAGETKEVEDDLAKNLLRSGNYIDRTPKEPAKATKPAAATKVALDLNAEPPVATVTTK